MPRVSERDGMLVKFVNWYTRRTYGRDTAVAGVMAHTKANLLGYGALEFGHERSHVTPERLKVLAATGAWQRSWAASSASTSALPWVARRA